MLFICGVRLSIPRGLDVLYRLWDCLLLEGPRILIGTALAVMEAVHCAATTTAEEAMEALQVCCSSADTIEQRVLTVSCHAAFGEPFLRWSTDYSIEPPLCRSFACFRAATVAIERVGTSGTTAAWPAAAEAFCS